MSRVPFQLLELSIISAQDLAPVSKNVRAYAVVWVNPDRKLRTRIEQEGQTNPVWNEKFVFRVDDAFLNFDKSFVMIEIYTPGWLRDTIVGSVRVMISNLIPYSVREETGSSKRFVALQIRRPSSRPQGILNMGVNLLDNTMHSMPLCTELSFPAMGFSDKKNKEKADNENKPEKYEDWVDKKLPLWRSMSDKTDLVSKEGGRKKKLGSYLGYGSTVNYDQENTVNGGGGGGGSVANGGSMVNGSVCNSDVGPSPSVVAAAVAAGLYPRQLGPPPKPGSSMLEDWKVEESSMEGLRSKIERWRMELPPLYDHKYHRLGNGAGTGNKKHNNRRRDRRKSTGEEDESGLFSCFGNAYGCEFQIICGTNNGSRKNKARGYSSSKIDTSELDS